MRPRPTYQGGGYVIRPPLPKEAYFWLKTVCESSHLKPQQVIRAGLLALSQLRQQDPSKADALLDIIRAQDQAPSDTLSSWGPDHRSPEGGKAAEA